MNREDSGAIQRLLTEALAGSDSAVPAPERPREGATPVHPDFQDLAAYIDGEISGATRERLETHLAGCAACRRLTMEASLAVQDRDATVAADNSKTAWWRLWRPALGLAVAALVVTLGLSLLRPGATPDAERLAAVGVSAAAIESASPELIRRAVDALAGNWPRPPEFDRFLASGRPVMRGPSAVAAPVPLAPRWSIVDDERPRFIWSLDLVATEYEILVVDENETLIAAFPIKGASTTGEITADYPADAEPLEAGKAYAWKVNARIAEESVASSYVPFIRASLEDQAKHRAELESASTSPLLRAVALAASGRYRPALEILRGVDGPQRDEMIGSVLALQHFSGRDLERQLRRWTSQ